MEDFILADNVEGVGAKGDRVSLALTPADVHDPTELSEYLAGYKPFGMRADEASPMVPVTKDEDKYRSFDSDNVFRRVRVKGSTQGAVPEVDPKSRLESYKVVERYIGSFVPRQTQDQTGPTSYDPVMAAGARCMTGIELDREIDVWTLLGTVANWNANQQTVASGAGWTDLVTGDPILDVQTAVESSDQPVSSIWMNQRVANIFLRHPAVRDHMRQFFGDSPQQGIAQAVLNAQNAGAGQDFLIPGIPPIKVVASKVLNETTGLIEYILADVAVLVTVPAGGVPTTGDEIATTYTFRRSGPAGTGVEVREFEIENRGPKGGTMIVVSVADIPILTANNAGGIISGVNP
jgi:hypothetical protein